jgi:hypothetical protein
VISATVVSRFATRKIKDRLVTFQVLGQQQSWRVRCLPDYGHPRSEPLNGEDELCAPNTRV